MPPREVKDRDGAYWCGQLYATLLVLKQLAKPGHLHFDENKLLKVKSRPEAELRTELSEMGNYLQLAMKRGTGPKESAASILRDISDMMLGALQDSKVLPASLKEAEAQNFAEGYRAQLSEHEKVHGRYFRSGW